MFPFVTLLYDSPLCYANLNLDIVHLFNNITLLTVPKEVLYRITGNLLGNGSIRSGSRTKKGKIKGNAKYQMTMEAWKHGSMDVLLIYTNFGTNGTLNWLNLLK